MSLACHHLPSQQPVVVVVVVVYNHSSSSDPPTQPPTKPSAETPSEPSDMPAPLAKLLSNSGWCPCHSWCPNNFSNSDSNLSGCCWRSCKLHCQVLHSTRGGEYSTRREGPWRSISGTSTILTALDRGITYYIWVGHARGRGDATQWQGQWSNIWQWVW